MFKKGHGPRLPDLITFSGSASLTQRVSDVSAAVRARFCTPTNQYPDVWAEDVRESSVVYATEGKYYEAPYAYNDGKPEIDFAQAAEVVKQSNWVAAFSLAEFELAFEGANFSDAEEVLIKNCKVFETGSYPDKNIAFEDADLDNAAAAFAPVKNDLEHRPSPLDGHLGETKAVRTARCPRTGKHALFADVTVPKWLKDVHDAKGLPIKVSLAWSKGKRIVGNAIVRNPRIADAALVAAFSAHGHEDPKPPMKLTISALMAGVAAMFAQNPNPDPNQEIDVSTFGKEGTPPTPALPAGAPAAAAVTPPAVAFYDTPEWKAMQENVRRSENTALNAAASSFAQGYVGKKIYAVGAEAVATQFSSAARFDASQEGKTLFSEDGKVHEGTAVAALKAHLDSLPNLVFSVEQLQGADLVPGSHDFSGGNKPADPAKVDKLLAATATGQRILKERAAKSGN